MAGLASALVTPRLEPSSFTLLHVRSARYHLRSPHRRKVGHVWMQGSHLQLGSRPGIKVRRLVGLRLPIYTAR
jgi:hypothetical protein